MFKKLWNIVVKACKVLAGAFNKKAVENFLPYTGQEEFEPVTKETVFSWTKWFSGKYRMTGREYVFKQFDLQSRRNTISACVITGLAICALVMTIGNAPAMALRFSLLALLQYVGNEIQNARIARDAFFA